MIQLCNPFFVEVPSFTRLYVFGAGGHGREVAWLAHQAWGGKVEIRFLVDHEGYLCTPINGIPVELLSDIDVQPSDRCVIAIGACDLRREKAEAAGKRSLVFASLVHPRAEMSSEVQIGEGVVICAGSIVTTNVHIGRHVHVNLDCTISHDVEVGQFSTLSPGVHVSGNVRIGRGVFIGTGANIINGQAGRPLEIGDEAIVAAGACVTKTVEPGALVAGVPAIRKR